MAHEESGENCPACRGDRGGHRLATPGPWIYTSHHPGQTALLTDSLPVPGATAPQHPQARRSRVYPIHALSLFPCLAIRDLLASCSSAFSCGLAPSFGALYGRSTLLHKRAIRPVEAGGCSARGAGRAGSSGQAGLGRGGGQLRLHGETPQSLQRNQSYGVTPELPQAG